MEQRAITLCCPNCGGKIVPGQKECDWCHSPVIITRIDELENMGTPQINKYVREYSKILAQDSDAIGINKSIGLCYLKLRLIEKALIAFEHAMDDDPDDNEIYYYTAICLLKGKKAFLSQLPTINRILEYLNAAIMLEEKGIYYYFMAYIKYDYFERKHLRSEPRSSDLFKLALERGVLQEQKEQLYELLGVEKPDML